MLPSCYLPQIIIIIMTAITKAIVIQNIRTHVTHNFYNLLLLMSLSCYWYRSTTITTTNTATAATATATNTSAISTLTWSHSFQPSSFRGKMNLNFGSETPFHLTSDQSEGVKKDQFTIGITPNSGRSEEPNQTPSISHCLSVSFSRSRENDLQMSSERQWK